MMAEYRQTIIVDKEQAWVINHAMNWKEGDHDNLRLGEYEAIIETREGFQEGPMGAVSTIRTEKRYIRPQGQAAKSQS